MVSNNRYQKTRYLTSAREIHQLPPDQGLEVAFAGRSNAGKSSALNALTQQRALARISKIPGRTQMINFFQVEPGRCLVDLPGYGYAKVPEALQQHWKNLLQRYLSERKALQGLILVMDVRHPLTPLDQQLLDWCDHAGLASYILLTKADKLKFGAASATLRQVQQAVAKRYHQTQVQLFSALRKTGVEAAQNQLDRWLGYGNPRGNAADNATID